MTRGILLTLAACGAPTVMVDPAPVAAVAPVATVAPPTAPPVAPVIPEAELGDMWLVIVASQPVAADEPAVLARLRSMPELAPRPLQLLSSRFRNLRPCLHVTVADATPDKATALTRVKALQAAGIDAYVKHAGAYVGPSSVIDAFCAAPPRTDDGSTRLAAFAGDALWLPEPTDEATLARLVGGAPPPVATSSDFDAWVQPLDALKAEAVAVTLVDAETGDVRSCTTGTQALLTLGTPHTGMYTDSEPLRSPACGTAARFTKVTCGAPARAGSWVAAPAGTPMAGYTPLGEGSPELVAAATALLPEVDGYPPLAASTDTDAGEQRTTAVTRWKGGSGLIAVIEAHVGHDGVCGGEDATFVGVYAMAGEGLGARLTAWWTGSFAGVVGPVDVGADGQPEVVVRSFPNHTEVIGVDGRTLGALDKGYCDCPC